MFLWLRKLFWQRCYYCKEKKQYFYYVWDLPLWDKIDVKYDRDCEVCTDCAKKGPEEI